MTDSCQCRSVTSWFRHPRDPVVSGDILSRLACGLDLFEDTLAERCVLNQSSEVFRLIEFEFFTMRRCLCCLNVSAC